MRFEIIKGAINSYKTNECINRIETIKKENPDARVLFIVPEQFSYSAENLITSHFDGTGLNNIEVVTMTRLAERYLNQSGKEYITKVGKAVLIQKAINNIESEDNIYIGSLDKPGFLDTVSDIITELKRCLITPQMLLECAEKSENNMLKLKLVSIAQIYSKYQELNADSFYDSEEDLTRLSLLILNECILSDAHIFIDEFSEFYPQHYRVIESIMKTAKSLYITLPYDSDNGEIYQIPLKTFYKLKMIAEKNKIKVYESNILPDKEFFKSKELDFYFKNYNRFINKNFVPYSKKTEDIAVFTARDPYSEIEYAAKKIRWLVDKEGYRYRDIAVCLGGAEEYNSIIEAVFNQYSIKYFADDKLPIVEHPVILTILSLFDIIKENWSYDSIFKYLKTGFVYTKNDDIVSPLPNDYVDLLDCYILKYGIKGKKKWLDDNEWELKTASISDALSDKKINNDDEIALINNIRKLIITPIKNFIEKTSKGNTVFSIATALFEFMEDINLYQGLLNERNLLISDNMVNEAQQLSQIWNILMDVLDQITTSLGDIKCSRDEFCKFLTAGLCVNEISIIPPTLDCVSVSGINAPGGTKVKALFVIGAVRGAIPLEKTETGMLSDTDRKEVDEILAGFNRELGGDSVYLRLSEEYKLYRLIFSSIKQLYISYPLNNFNGEAQMPSGLIIDLRKIFSDLEQKSDLFFYDTDFERFFTLNSAFDYLLKNRNNTNDKIASDIYTHFFENDKIKDKLGIIKEADLYKTQNSKISSKNAELLYRDMLNYSASKLKVYAECPFKYFLKYGLGAKPEEIWQIQKFDLGTVMHYIICKYCETVSKDADNFEALRQKWINLTNEESNEIVDSIILDVTENITKSVGKDEDKIKYLLMRIKRIINRSVEIVKNSLIKGDYVAVEYEKEFYLKLDDTSDIKVKGTIDRIDLSKSEDVASIRVIDYKSGKKDFSIISVCNMLDIQLVLYATAAGELYKMGKVKHSDPHIEPKVTGMMYNKLKDIIVEAEGEDKANIDKKISKEMKLNGVVILDSNENEQPDITNAVMMDSDIELKGESSYLNFSLTGKGEISKRSEYLSRSDFDKLTEYVKRKIIKTNRKIMFGDTQILPACDKNSSVCDYCEMAEVCLFDKNLDSVRNLCTDTDTAWEIIDNELKK